MKAVVSFIVCGMIFINSSSLAAGICDAVKKWDEDRKIMPETRLISMCHNLPEAEAGDPTKQYFVGSYYWDEKNYEEAAKWLEKAAEQGDPYAAGLLGPLYRDGKGVRQDYSQAIKWISRGAEVGTASSQFDLAELYANGQGVEQNLETAYFWMKLAEKQSKIGYSGDGDSLKRPGQLRALLEQLSRDQILAVDARVKNWKPVKFERQ